MPAPPLPPLQPDPWAPEAGVLWSPWVVPTAVGGLLGAAAQLQQAMLLAAEIYGLILAIALLLYSFSAIVFFRENPYSHPVMRISWWTALLLRWCLPCVLAALAGGAVSGLRAVGVKADQLHESLAGRDVQVVGVVSGLPQVAWGGQRFVLQVESAVLDGQAVRLPQSVAVGWYAGVDRSAGPPQLHSGPAAPVQALVTVGDRWRFTLRLKPNHGVRNAQGFDWELWMWKQGLGGTATVRASAHDVAPVRLAQSVAYPVERWRQQVRDAIRTHLMQSPSAVADTAAARAAGVVAALVTGDQRAIDQADWDVFRATGVAHLMSISGLHITLFAWVASAVLRRVWRLHARLPKTCPAPWAAGVGGLLLALAYAVFSGWGLPAQRTIGMLGLVTLLQLLGRRWPWPVLWLALAWLAVLLDPWALLDAGFWLSYVAVGVLFAQPWAPGGASLPPATAASTNAWVRTLGRTVQWLRQLWAEQWRLSFALAPLGLLLFGQVSLVGLLANVLAIPWVTWVVTPLAFAGVLVPPLWDGAAIAVQGLGVCLEAMAHWPWAVLEKPAVPLAWSLGAVIGAVLLMAPLPWASRGCGLLLALPWLWWVPPGVPLGEVRVVALDVGQGSAVVVQTAHHALLYDTGPRYSQDSDAGHRVVVPWLRAQGLQPDRVALSHADIDHTGGTRAVLSRFPGADVLADPGWFNPPPGWTGSVSPCAAPLLWQWDGVVFEVLHPGAGAPVDTRGSRSKTNPLSCVIHITASSGRSALLTGDLEAAQERALVERLGPAALAADWLLVPHHGSRTSSTAALLAAVGPRVAVVQAGYRNRFGHPAPDVLARYQAQGVQPATTVECGSATWQSDSAGNLGCERERKHRYWQHSSALPASLSRP